MKKIKTIIIIGASGGIGSVLARFFHSLGWNVALASRTEEKLVALQKTLGEERTLVVPMDATNAEDARKLFRLTREKWGSVDAVVITAGTWKRLSIEDSVEDAVALIGEHYKSIFLPSYVAGTVAKEFFLEQGYGLIVDISSHAAVKTDLPGNLTYAPMKAAQRSFMLCLREEFLKAGARVRVADIQPALVDTPKNLHLFKTKEEQEKAVQPETIARWIADHIDDPAIPAEILFKSDIEIK